ncbi:MAG: signal recognition particle protein, partial [Rhodobacteraceae bacterium]|nr:signal recognition particle protein [Paracoccaceae bacterium]
RIAAGAGLDVAELNKLLKMQRQMADVMKKMGKGGMLKQAMKSMFGKNPDMADIQKQMADPEAMKAAQMAMGRGGGLPGLGGGLPGGLSGLGLGKKR